MYAADSELSPTGLRLYDVGGPEPVVVATQALVCSNPRDLSASPDGTRVVTACGPDYEHKVYSADKLAFSGSYPTGRYPLAGAWSADGATFVAGIDSAYEPDVYVFRQGWNAPARIGDFGGEGPGEAARPGHLGERVARVDGDRGVVGRPGAARARRASTGLQPADGERHPGAFYPGSSTTLSGRLGTVAGAALPGEVLRVSRAAAGEAPVVLPSVTTGPDGGFAFSGTPPRPARTGGTPIYGTVRLYYDGSDSELSEHVTTVTLDANGGATFADAPPRRRGHLHGHGRAEPVSTRR